MKWVFWGAALLALALTLAGCELFAHRRAGSQPLGNRVVDGVPVCPVMGETVDIAEGRGDPALHSLHGGKLYVFCCPACKSKFDSDPEGFLAAEAASQPARQ